jgi:hypothetical protein
VLRGRIHASKANRSAPRAAFLHVIGSVHYPNTYRRGATMAFDTAMQQE